jgi:hypothetical protein
MILEPALNVFDSVSVVVQVVLDKIVKELGHAYSLRPESCEFAYDFTQAALKQPFRVRGLFGSAGLPEDLPIFSILDPQGGQRMNSAVDERFFRWRSPCSIT